MGENDSNLTFLKCPFCNCHVTQEKDKEGKKLVIELDEDFDFDFYKCPSCEKYIKIELEVDKEYNYYAYPPTSKEIEDYKIEVEEDKSIKDVPGQILMWPEV